MVEKKLFITLRPGYITRLVILALSVLLLLLLSVACDGEGLNANTSPAASKTLPATATLLGENTPTPELPATPTPSIAGGYDCTGVTGLPGDECLALIALYHSTGGPNWIDNSDWLDSNTPCSWAGITCTRDHVSHVYLSNNNLVGTLPPALGSLSQLQVLDLLANELRGPVPAELGNLSELRSLYLSDNQFSGSIPPEMGELRKLQDLSLARNQLEGLIPTSLGTTKSLQSLDLSHNELSGTIPGELGELENLYALDLSHNQLSGTIPASLGDLASLDELDLSYNQLTGSAPEALSQVERLSLWGNLLDATVDADGRRVFTVDYQEIRFRVDSSLATAVWPEVVPASPLPESLDGPGYWLAIPEHRRFTFADPDLAPERRRMGYNLAAEGQILVFPLAELAGMNTLVPPKIGALRNMVLLGSPPQAGELPLLPLTNAAQVFHAQEKYLTSSAVEGLRYISQVSQEPQPIMLSTELFYTFQGLSIDGAYYVAAFFPLSTAALPVTIEIEDWDAFHASYDAYLAETTARLDQLSPADFMPDLSLLDALVTSIGIEAPDAEPGILSYVEPIIVELLPAVTPLDLDLDPAAGLISYQRDKQLWLARADLSGQPTQILECFDQDQVLCRLPTVHWSPDGSAFFYEITVNGEHRLIISDLQGQQQGFRLSRQPSRDPVWSPDGQRIVLFIKDTDRPWGNHGNPELSPLEIGFNEEVWQLQLDPSGVWLASQKMTDLQTPGIGCGGGGGSTSDALYDMQGGFTLGYQAAGRMAWSVDEVIIYPLTCDYWGGYGRLDSLAWQPLAPYDGQLRGLTLDASATRWFAITGSNRTDDPVNNRLVTGTAAGTGYQVIKTAVPVEMIFVGQQSGNLYYTSRQLLDHKDLSEQIQWDMAVLPYFNFYHSQLWTIQPDGSGERLLWESDDHSYSRVTETTDGDILFVLVENDVELYEIIAGGAPEAEWLEHLPHTHIMRLSPSTTEPGIWLEDSHSLTIRPGWTE